MSKYANEKYTYDGPVMLFDGCVANNWRGETYAVSETKAKNNLAYQFRRENRMAPNTKVSLPGRLYKVRRFE